MAMTYDPPLSATQEPPAAEEGEVFVLPASQGQQRFWFLDKLEPHSAVHNVSVAFWLRGQLDSAVLERVLLELTARHETLRTTFAVEADQPVQVIAVRPKLALNRIDLERLEPEKREEAVDRLGTEEARRPFDLARGPLVRITVARVSAREHLLLLILHHSICDGWSFGVLFREFAALYEAYAAGKPSPLSDVPIQYADYAHWQREWLSGEGPKRHLDYWQRQLAGAPAFLALPTDHPRPPMQRYRGATWPVQLAAELVVKLKALSAQEGATLFMTLLAAWQALLARYTGQDDIVVGSPIAGRTRKETEGVFGFFVNVLAFRTKLDDDPSFDVLLRRVRETALEAYEHQDLPFEKLVEVLQPERNLSFSPLFQVQIILQNTPPIATQISDLVLQSKNIHNGTAKFDLTLMLEEVDGSLTGDLEYSTDLFDQASIIRLAKHFEVLLNSIVAHPGQSVSTLSLLTEAERRHMLVEWNDTAVPYPADRCIHELVEAQAARTPEAVAVVFEGQQVTYAQLNERANQLAHYLRGLGVGPGRLVGLCVERSLDMVVGVLAILKAGGAYVPLDPAYPPDRLAFMLEDAGVAALVTQSAIRVALPPLQAPVVLLDGVAERLRREPRTNPPQSGSASNLAYVIYTSGSTGRPKGVMISHRALVNFVSTMQSAPGLQGSDTLLAVTSLSFDIAGLEIYLPLVSGARLVVACHEVTTDAWRLGALLRESGATVMQATPTTWRMLLAADWPGQANLVMLCGGEALAGDLAHALLERGKALWNLYGPTETTIWSTAHQVRREDARMCIGRPIGNTQLYVLDRALQPLPIGVPGELYIGGLGLADGYLHQPELTTKRFVAHPFSHEPNARLYRTGDLVRYRSTGEVEYLERIDQQVKLRGHRIELGEIEVTLREQSGIRDVAVMAREDTPGDMRLVAYVAPRQGRTVRPADLRAALRERLPDYMVPTAWVTLEALPLTPNGKVDRRALPAPGGRPPGPAKTVYAKPTLTLHYQLTQIWEELLDVQPIGITDHFFELGGHSLLAARMVERIERVCGKRLPLATLFHEPTIEHLARVLLNQEGDAPEPRIFPLQTKGSKRPFFFLHGDREGGGFYTATLSARLGTDQPFYVLPPCGMRNGRVPRTIEAMAAAHLKDVRAVQPRGPYLLGGFCTDGLVAFEMAQQLRSQGEQVDILALMDTAPPERRRQRIRRIIEEAGRWVGLDADGQMDLYLGICAYDARRHEFLALDIGEQAQFALTQLRRTREWLGSRLRQRNEAGKKKRQRRPITSLHRDINGIYRWIEARYRPRWYSGRVTIFWAEDESLVEGTAAIASWQRLAADVESYIIPGSHLSFITTNGEELGDQVARCVAAAQAGNDTGGC